MSNNRPVLHFSCGGTLQMCDCYWKQQRQQRECKERCAEEVKVAWPLAIIKHAWLQEVRSWGVPWCVCAQAQADHWARPPAECERDQRQRAPAQPGERVSSSLTSSSSQKASHSFCLSYLLMAHPAPQALSARHFLVLLQTSSRHEFEHSVCFACVTKPCFKTSTLKTWLWGCVNKQTTLLFQLTAALHGWLAK